MVVVVVVVIMASKPRDGAAPFPPHTFGHAPMAQHAKEGVRVCVNGAHPCYHGLPQLAAHTGPPPPYAPPIRVLYVLTGRGGVGGGGRGVVAAVLGKSQGGGHHQ